MEDSNSTSPSADTMNPLSQGSTYTSKEDFIANGMDPYIPPSDFRCPICQNTPSRTEDNTSPKNNNVHTTSSANDPSRSESNASLLELAPNYPEIILCRSATPRNDGNRTNNRCEPDYDDHTRDSRSQNPFPPLSASLFGIFAIRQPGTDDHGCLPTPFPILSEGEDLHKTSMGIEESSVGPSNTENTRPLREVVELKPCLFGGHRFCKGCILTWVDSTNTCPSCRTVLYPSPSEVVFREPTLGMRLAFADLVQHVAGDLDMAQVIRQNPNHDAVRDAMRTFVQDFLTGGLGHNITFADDVPPAQSEVFDFEEYERSYYAGEYEDHRDNDGE